MGLCLQVALLIVRARDIFEILYILGSWQHAPRFKAFAAHDYCIIKAQLPSGTFIFAFIFPAPQTSSGSCIEVVART